MTHRPTSRAWSRRAASAHGRLDDRGFALLTVLWLVAALSLVAGISVLAARVGLWTTRNRIGLIRATWAREACHEILLARYARDTRVRRIDTVDLGRGTWCQAELGDAGAALDINTLSADEWRMILGNDTLVDAVLDWRDTDDVARPLGAEQAWYRAEARRLPRNGPFASVAELRYVRGFDSARVHALEHVVRARGTAQVDLNTAPSEVLQILPGLTPEAVTAILEARRIGQRIAGPDDLLDRLFPPARAALLDRYTDFLRRVAFEPVQFVESLEGGVIGIPVVSHGWLIVVPAAGRLAVVHREME